MEESQIKKEILQEYEERSFRNNSKKF